jgi:hypothetical protein
MEAAAGDMNQTQRATKFAGDSVVVALQEMDYSGSYSTKSNQAESHFTVSHDYPTLAFLT